MVCRLLWKTFLAAKPGAGVGKSVEGRELGDGHGFAGHEGVDERWVLW